MVGNYLCGGVGVMVWVYLLFYSDGCVGMVPVEGSIFFWSGTGVFWVTVVGERVYGRYCDSPIFWL